LRLLKRPISGKPEIGCDAPQHEGRGAAHFGKPSGGAGAKTNLRLWETIAGLVSLFSARSLQGAAQLQRVEPSARRSADIPHPGRRPVYLEERRSGLHVR
jgi:hypothetical protein